MAGSAIATIEQPRATFPDVYFMLAAKNPRLANWLDMGCRAGQTIDAFLAGAATVQFTDPAVAAQWRSGIAMVRAKVHELGAGSCTWSDPNASTMAAMLPGMRPPVTTSASSVDPSTGQPGGPTYPPPSGQPPPTQPWDYNPRPPQDTGWQQVPDQPPGPCEVLQGGARCGSVEGGHCGDKCGGKCDSCIRPQGANQAPVCVWDATPMSPISLSQACSQPGRWNCETIDADLSKCEIDRIRRTQRTWSTTASTGAGLITVPTDAAHPTPAGYTLIAIELPAVRLSHFVCLRSVTITAQRPGGGAPVSVIPDMVYIEVEKLYQEGDGQYVHAWSYAKPEEEEYITIKDGRCACARLCDCVPARSRVRISALIPTLDAGTVYTMSAKGKRECWGALCGACPPELICDRSVIIPPAGAVVLPDTAAGMIDMIETNAGATGVSVFDVFEQIIAEAPANDVTAAAFAATFAAEGSATWKGDVLNPLIALYASIGWTAAQLGAALNAAGGTLDVDVFSFTLASGYVTGLEYATYLTLAPAGVRSGALAPLIANYAANGWTASQVAQAIDLAGGTLDVDVNTAVAVNNYITGTQYATAIQYFNAGNKSQILTTSIANYAANGWTAANISTALQAAGGTLAADVKALLP